MEERITINNQEICNQIDQLLIEEGLRSHSLFNTPAGYTKEELNKVTMIYLGNSTSIEELLKLPNLKKLKIKSSSQDTVIEEDPFAINHIADFSLLSYLTNLEELTIVNDPTIEKIVLSPLKNLKKIKLCNNPHLKSIIGLDQLKNLKNILIYGNAKEPQIDPLAYLENTKEAEKNYLDITMFYDMCEENSEFEKLYLKYIDNYETSLKFVEKVGIYNYYVPFQPTATIKLYQEAEDIIQKPRVRFRLSTKEKIRALYLIARNKIKYDYETLDKRDVKSLKEAMQSEQKSYRLSLPNTSYSALVEKKSVCEGYANMLHLLFHMCGINSRVIYCSTPENYMNGLDHAALKVEYHDQWYYLDADPNWGKDDEEFFMVEKEEFEKTHVLAASEKESGKNDVKRYYK